MPEASLPTGSNKTLAHWTQLHRKEDGSWTRHCSTVVPIVFELGLLVRSDVIHSVFGDDTDVDVVARAEVVHDAGLDGGSYQLLGPLHLKAARRLDYDRIRTGEVTE